MTCRVEIGVTYLQTYTAENRIASIAKLASGSCASPGNYSAKWDFTYDGDGVRTGQSYTPYTNGTPGTAVITRYYFGGAYETTGSTWRKYYFFAGQTVAMRDSTGLKYFLTDHLGSILAVSDSSGTLISQQRYLPFGQVRKENFTMAWAGSWIIRQGFIRLIIDTLYQQDSQTPHPTNCHQRECSEEKTNRY